MHGSPLRSRAELRHGFSLVELLVVIAVIVILLALILPAIAASRAASRAAQCARQLEQIGAALTKTEMARVTAVPAQWTVKLAPYLDDAAKIVRCPDDLNAPSQSSVVPSYGVNSRTHRFQGGDSHKIVALDYKAAVANVVGPAGTDDWATMVAPRHRGNLHTLQTDGSVQRRKPDEIDPRVCDLHDRLWRPTRDFALVKPGCMQDASLLPAADGTGSTSGATPQSPCAEFSAQGLAIAVAPTGSGSVNEGDAGANPTIQYGVSLSQAVSKTVQVQVGTVNGSATAGQDYNAVNQAVTFAPGETSKTVDVTVVGDANHEPDETFSVMLSGATYDSQSCAEITYSPAALGTIYNDDAYNPGGGDPNPCHSSGPEAVDRGLQWIVRHQRANGSWSLMHTDVPGCDPAHCTNPGLSDMDTAATGMALLPLIGGGSTPVSGPYREAVCKGITYLLAVQDQVSGRLDQGGIGYVGLGQLYEHLIAHLALAEALAAAQGAAANGCASESPSCAYSEAALRAGVTKALTHTIYSRCDFDGTVPPVNHDGSQWLCHHGGWQYCPKTVGCYHDQDDCGDMSHHGWGVAALKATQAAGISVPPEEFQIADYFLWSHQYDPVTDPSTGTTIGKRYGYMTPGWVGNGSMTPIGLYCRTLLGHPVSHVAFDDFRNGLYPPNIHAYHNMYAAQVMYRIGGNAWQTWSQQFQAQFMPQQATAAAGHADGSWYWQHQYTYAGGRLYCTAAVLLSLEAHFRGLRLSQ